jgi:thioredoxin-related protein
MRKLLSGAIVFCASVALAEEPFQPISFESACKKAKQEKKVVLLDFCTTWCGPCKMLDRTTWKDGKVRAWIRDNTVAIKIDGDQNRELCSKFVIRSYPTLLFLRSDGAELKRLIGYRDAKEFLDDAKGAVRDKYGVSRAGTTVENRGKDDPLNRMQNGAALAQNGKKKEALAEYLWCYDHGLEASPAFKGMRLSYLLAYIRQLGNDYPPAIEALRVRRDRAENELLNDKSVKKTTDTSGHPRSRFDAASEVAAINRELNQQERTASVYKKLMAGGEEDRRVLCVLIDDAIDPLIKSNEYSSIVAGFPNPLAAVEQKIESYQSMKDAEESDPQNTDRRSSELFRRRALNHGSKIFEALVGVKDSTNAQKVAARLLQFDGGRAIYETLMEHALRANGHEQVIWLLELARKKFVSEELASLEVLATRKSKLY